MVHDVLPEPILGPVWEEYSADLDGLAGRLLADGKISSVIAPWPSGTFSRILAEFPGLLDFRESGSAPAR